MFGLFVLYILHWTWRSAEHRSIYNSFLESFLPYFLDQTLLCPSPSHLMPCLCLYCCCLLQFHLVSSCLNPASLVWSSTERFSHGFEMTLSNDCQNKTLCILNLHFTATSNAHLTCYSLSDVLASAFFFLSLIFCSRVSWIMACWFHTISPINWDNFEFGFCSTNILLFWSDSADFSCSSYCEKLEQSQNQGSLCGIDNKSHTNNLSVILCLFLFCTSPLTQLHSQTV